MFVSGPSPHGPNVPFSLDVLEASVVQQAFEEGSRTRVQPDLSGGGEEEFVEISGSVVLREGIVRGPPFQVEIDEFDLSARFGMPS